MGSAGFVLQSLARSVPGQVRRTGDSYEMGSGHRDWRTGVKRVALTTVEAPPSLTVPSSGPFRQASGPTRSGTFRQNCVSPLVPYQTSSTPGQLRRCCPVRGRLACAATGLSWLKGCYAFPLWHFSEHTLLRQYGLRAGSVRICRQGNPRCNQAPAGQRRYDDDHGMGLVSLRVSGLNHQENPNKLPSQKRPLTRYPRSSESIHASNPQKWWRKWFPRRTVTLRR